MTNKKKSENDIQNKNDKYSTVKQQLQDYDINNVDDLQNALENILDKTLKDMKDLGMEDTFIGDKTILEKEEEK